MTDRILIELTREEALVLFEYLAGLDSKEFSIAHAAEQKVLWRIEGILEKALSEVVSPDYQELLQDARSKVLASNPESR